MFRNLLKSFPKIYRGGVQFKPPSYGPFIMPLITNNSFANYSTLSPNEPKNNNGIQEIVDESDISDEEDPKKPLKAKRDKEELYKSHIEEFKFVEVENKILIKCSYGYFDLKGLSIENEKLKKFKNVYFLDDQVPVNYIRKILKADPQCLVVFEPSSHYFNMASLYNGYRKKLYLHFFGTKKKPRNPFKNCKDNGKIFNLSRRINIQIRALLSRICLIVNYDGTLRLKGENIPFSDTLKNIIAEGGPSKIGMYKFNYFVPVGYWFGIHSSDEWEKKGITIDCLSGKKIYPLYSVWSPTNQNYLTLLNKYLENKKNSIKSRKAAIDLGCGTGILSFMLVQIGGCKQVYAVDSNLKAAECTKLNAQILDIKGAINVGYMDLAKVVKSNKSLEVLKNMEFPSKYELIVANPPWIVASRISSEHELDNGIYDPKEEILTSIFRFASLHLTTENALNKNGILLLYYSDLSQLLGLQAPERIEKLCEEYNFIIKDITSTNFIDAQVEKEVDHDPLVNFKNKAKIHLYEITRS